MRMGLICQQRRDEGRSPYYDAEERDEADAAFGSSVRLVQRFPKIMSLILIVEDNEKNMKLVRDVLQVKGYATVEAGTAEDGIRLALERNPELILMDIQLPGMSGIDALGVLRANPATAAIPVIAVTASVMQQDRKQITEAGFDGYVGKPINLKEFLDAVRAMLEKARP